MSDVVKRKAQRLAYCRVCDDEIPIGQVMVSWYSHRNRGQNIFLHLHCAEAVGNLAKNKDIL